MVVIFGLNRSLDPLFTMSAANPTTLSATTALPLGKADAALLREVAELLVATLNLETPAADIVPDEPLYGEGLGLDSIDILEVALVISRQYGLELRADHEDNGQIFGSLRSLCEHIAAQRTK